MILADTSSLELMFMLRQLDCILSAFMIRTCLLWAEATSVNCFSLQVMRLYLKAFYGIFFAFISAEAKCSLCLGRFCLVDIASCDHNHEFI